jgi:hypothetical protein
MLRAALPLLTALLLVLPVRRGLVFEGQPVLLLPVLAAVCKPAPAW